MGSTTIGRAGASQPTIHIAHARATGKPAHCKFKGRTFSLAASNSHNVQPTILALGRCQRLLDGSPYGHLHMKQQPRYVFSTVNRAHIILYRAIQRACCPPVYSLLNVPCSLMDDLDYCHKTHDRACGFSISATASGVAPLAQNA